MNIKYSTTKFSRTTNTKIQYNKRIYAHGQVEPRTVKPTRVESWLYKCRMLCANTTKGLYLMRCSLVETGTPTTIIRTCLTSSAILYITICCTDDNLHFIYVFIYLFVCIFICLFVCLFIYLFIWLFICLFIYLLIYLFVYSFTYCLIIYLSISQCQYTVITNYSKVHAEHRQMLEDVHIVRR